MLVLKRAIGEKIVIADGLIKIVLVAVEGQSARIGIEAPRDIRVNREEVQQDVEKSGPKKSAEPLVSAK